MHDDAVRWLTDLISYVATITSFHRDPSHKPLIACGGGSHGPNTESLAQWPTQRQVAPSNRKGKNMHKLLALLVGLSICSAAKAQTITDPDRIVQQLELWT